MFFLLEDVFGQFYHGHQVENSFLSILTNSVFEREHMFILGLLLTSFACLRSIPDDVAESSLAPLKIHNAASIRASCQPFKWLEVAKTIMVQCPNKHRKAYLEEICLRENQKLISDIFVRTGPSPKNWDGVTVHCPLTKTYDELKVKLFIKVKVGEKWISKSGKYEVSTDEVYV